MMLTQVRNAEFGVRNGANANAQFGMRYVCLSKREEEFL